ncbi:ROK family protein [Glaciecola petra]|uniref:fructokinase n=1 Tax=Glaciecola petra TaxID=3075602 RepID=A0ABU2ZY86_9ALTE|nr:ROK family protein [Aestuariibacter sp. P117]MDT0596377.1 ROK family protein [Aestuariibacter sp. P117]
MTKYYAVIEAGGTKFRCAVINDKKQIVEECRVPTRMPKDTLADVLMFFKREKVNVGKYSALGIASFGPLDLDITSPTFGFITKTPKSGWTGTSLAVPLAQSLDCPVALDTDVNGAAIAEHMWGAGQRKSVVIYITVGTGIGGGVVIDGKPLHGLIHPEIGHTLIPGHPSISGVCPFHSNCAEGLGSGAALNEIWGQPAETLAPEHQAWDIEAHILSQLSHNLLVCYSPQKIIFGGGLFANEQLIDSIITKTERSLANYLSLPESISLNDVIVPTGLGQESGILGAFALAQSCA